MGIKLFDFVYESPKRGRFHRYGIGIQVTDGMTGNWVYWRESTRSWNSKSEPGDSNTFACLSLKAFKRHVKRHKNILGLILKNGGSVCWINHIVGADVEIKLREDRQWL